MLQIFLFLLQRARAYRFFLEAMAAGLQIATIRELLGVSDVNFNNNVIRIICIKNEKITINNNIRKNISEIAKKYFNWADISKKYLYLYKSLLLY